MAPADPAKEANGRETAVVGDAAHDNDALWLTPDAVAYLQRNGCRSDEALRLVAAQAATAFPDQAIDEGLAAILLHGERRTVDRWRDAAGPLSMPNRRRPPPIVAAEEVVDVEALRADLARAWTGGSLASGVADLARWLGLREPTAAEDRCRRHITRGAIVA